MQLDIPDLGHYGKSAEIHTGMRLNKYILFLSVLFLLSGCSSAAIINLENKNSELEERIHYMETHMNDTDKDGSPDYLDEESYSSSPYRIVDSFGNIINFSDDRMLDALKTSITQYYDYIRLASGPGEAEDYFTSLDSSAEVKIPSFFKSGESLKNCHDKLVSKIQSVLHYQDGEYKYFPLSNGGFGIITKIQCIDLGGTRSENCKATKGCPFFNIGCVEEGHSQFFLFLITKKDVDGVRKFSMKEFLTMMKDGALDSNYNAIPRLKSLISENNKYNEDYSFYIRLFEIKKAAMAKP